MDYVSLNGQMVPYEDAGISVGDAGFLHGAGLFETMRAHKRKVFRLADHVERLMKSAAELGLAASLGARQVAEMIDELLEANDLADARIRLTVTRGAIHTPAASPGTPEDAEPDVTVLLTAAAFTPYPAALYDKGMVTVISNCKQNPANPLTGHKTTSYMDRLLALRAAQRAGAGEALWFTPGNETLAEGSISNVFIVDKQGLLATPPLMVRQVRPDGSKSECRLCLPGITRRVVLEIANDLGMIVHERAITIEELLEAPEVFLTNAVMGVMPVVRIEMHAVGGGAVGDITRQVLEGHRARVEKECGESK